ncbi:PTS fructose-like transporter subunit IIB [Oceanimonas baumannii]|uniref:protein-N(pi)-phosphohistidine--D-fructose phosphotransferase n=1 Tax=Oceanimonas baumannii TaxID=129578 RepID=A0A235CLI4_9GAMM|nr:PTS fructose-like transporter subunit IIB [Oceanimonas baumannii]OYD25224.1 PTS fructose transporter subunit EIIBC [Oceanimonas baumannii]TDW62483.1 PTS system fructose-specific IIC component [Oceanimonas baumannii]
MKVLIITASPDGMSGSYMAARMLEQAATLLGWQVAVECHSELAPVIPFTQTQVAEAGLVVVAACHLPELSRFAGKPCFIGELEDALNDPQGWLERASADAVPLEIPAHGPGQPARLVAITACPTGVAHTFMSAEALIGAAKRLGHSIKVETQGSVGVQNTLTATDIREADCVIVAADIEVNLSRFNDKRLYRTGTGTALKHPRETIETALNEAAVWQDHSEQSGDSGEQAPGPYQHLLTGVSFMLPMVVAGGLIIALSFMFGIEAFREEGTLAAALMKIGDNAAFALMIPVLSGYIAYSIADRPGIAPGMIGGMLASSLGAGFIGGIIAGFLAGYSAVLLARRLPMPKSLASLTPILLIPLLASLFTGLVMIYVVGEPVASIMTVMTGFLNNMGSANAVLLGVIIGAMMCFDMGGPVNKAAYAFSVGLLASQTYAPMAAAMAAGMVPALGMGIATVLARRKFSVSEQEAGKASFVLGLCFISEGAIPFAARDPLRVIPSCMAGGALTGALSMVFGAKLLAPHGGVFVLMIPGAVQQPGWYGLAIAAGALLTGLVYAVLKRGNVHMLAQAGS